MSKIKNSLPTYVIPSLVILAFTILGFSLYCIYLLDPGTKPGPTKSVLQFSQETEIGGEYSLIDTQGNEFTHEKLNDKISLIYFGFSYCPDVCPTIVQIMSVAMKQIPESLRDRVQAIFVSLDPERDTPQQISNFLSNYDYPIIGLTGSKDEIQKMADNYKVFFQKVASQNKDDDNYLLDHSSIIYMMGSDGKYIKHFSAKASSEEISQEIFKNIKK